MQELNKIERNMDSNFNLNAMCRICLCDGKMRALNSQADESLATYTHKILNCLNIELTTNPSFPENICSKCVADLEAAYRFRMNCESTEAILNTYVKQEQPAVNNDMDFDDHHSFGGEDHEDPDLVVKKEKQPKKPVVKKSQGGNARCPQICELCGKEIRSRSQMRVHMRRHTGERPFECTYCLKTFADSSGLRCHVRIHTGEKPFSCQHCDRKFNDLSTKNKHQRTHTGERPYICSYCGRGFAYRDVLSNHVKTHTGEKNYHCHLCTMSFVKGHNLKVHQNVHLREQGKAIPTKKRNKKPTQAADGSESESE